MPRDVASRNSKQVCDEGRGVGETGLGVYLDFADAINRLGKSVVRERYGNLFDMYERITGEDPYSVPMRIYPAIHYTMGGLWVDYQLMSTIPGLFVIGEANFSDHGANRLGASALMQGLADGYFILPYTLGNYLASNKLEKISTSHQACTSALAEVDSATNKLLSIKGKRTVDSFHRELGKIMWDQCGMARNAGGLQLALRRIPELASAAAAVGQHHERWDGTGYPRQLSGADIRLSARIIAACDVFDALVTARPYKRAWRTDEAIEELCRGASSQFDPEVVAVLTRVLESEQPLAQAA